MWFSSYGQDNENLRSELLVAGLVIGFSRTTLLHAVADEVVKFTYVPTR
jgi:hypothetical protein